MEQRWRHPQGSATQLSEERSNTGQLFCETVSGELTLRPSAEGSQRAWGAVWRKVKDAEYGEGAASSTESSVCQEPPRPDEPHTQQESTKLADVSFPQNPTGLSKPLSSYPSSGKADGNTRKPSNIGRYPVAAIAEGFLRQDLKYFLETSWDTLYQHGLYETGTKPRGVDALDALALAKCDGALGSLRMTVALLRNFDHVADIVDNKKRLREEGRQASIGPRMAKTAAYNDYLAETSTGSLDKSLQDTQRERLKDHLRYAKRWHILISGTEYVNNWNGPAVPGLGAGLLLVCSDRLASVIYNTHYANEYLGELLSYVREHRPDVVEKCLVMEESAQNLSKYEVVCDPSKPVQNQGTGQKALENLLARLDLE